MTETAIMERALRLARRGYGLTAPNPMVGAVLVKAGKIIGEGWHHRAGEPHAEVEAIRHAIEQGYAPKRATLYVTLEPCSTHGRTPPCTEAIVAAGIERVVTGATDPNPAHKGKAFAILQRAGVQVSAGLLGEECAELNEAFNHWIVSRTPFVTVKSATTIDGRIATVTGDSKWITGERARAWGMRLRLGADAILVGINTVLADNPKLTLRGQRSGDQGPEKRLRRIVLDAGGMTPLTSKVVRDEQRDLTTIVVSRQAPEKRIRALARHVRVLIAPSRRARDGRRLIDLKWLLNRLGAEKVTHLLVEGGGEVSASFLLGGFVQRVAFFYAPKIFGGRAAPRAVGGAGVRRVRDALKLSNVEWRRLGDDFLLTGRVQKMGIDLKPLFAKQKG